MRPPFHRDQVAEPLVSQLVANYQGNPLLCRGGRVGGIDQQRRLSEGL